ncbi:DMT family transporter [Maritalea sp.]|uniref:DMT family transporter n=1 Tax=Maritalea sp. TaxID=2003361 RepID=UPI003EF2BC10
MINILLWLLLAAVWSSSYAFIKIGVATIDPMLLVFGRMAIGALLLLGVLAFMRKSLSKDLQSWKLYAVTGILGNALPFFLISFGELNVDSSLAAILMGGAPIVTVVLAHFVLPGEELTSRSSWGVVVGFSGVIALFGFGALSAIGSHIMGQLALVGAAVCYAANTIIVKRSPKKPPLEMAAGSMLVGAACIGIASLVFVDFGTLASPNTESLVALVYLGVFPTAMAALIYFFLIVRLDARHMSQINFAVPVGGALIGVLWLGEPFGPTRIFALLIIVSAIILVSSKGAKSRQAKSAL